MKSQHSITRKMRQRMALVKSSGITTTTEELLQSLNQTRRSHHPKPKLFKERGSTLRRITIRTLKTPTSISTKIKINYHQLLLQITALRSVRNDHLLRIKVVQSTLVSGEELIATDTVSSDGQMERDMKVVVFLNHCDSSSYLATLYRRVA